MLIFSGVWWLVSKSWQENNTKVAAKVAIWSKNPPDSLQNIPLVSVGFGRVPSQTRHVLEYITVISIQERKTGFWGKTSSWRRKSGSDLGFPSRESNNLCPSESFLGNPAHSAGRAIQHLVLLVNLHIDLSPPFSCCQASVLCWIRLKISLFSGIYCCLGRCGRTTPWVGLHLDSPAYTCS